VINDTKFQGSKENPIRSGETHSLPQFRQAAKRLGRYKALSVTYLLLFWMGITIASTLAMQNLTPSVSLVHFAILRFLSGILFTGPLWWIYTRPWFDQLKIAQKILILTIACAGSSFLEQNFLERMGGPSSFSHLMDDRGFIVINLLPLRFLMYSMWSIGFLSIRMITHFYRLQISLSIAESAARNHQLRHLQSQMNPHFLFNALNVILAQKDNPSDVELITYNLAAYLRNSMNEFRDEEPLSEELNNLQHYLIIQQCRFGENLKFRVKCELNARNVLIPPVLIQPLIENAIHYGYSTCKKPLRVETDASITGEFLKITVSNNGHWVKPDPKRSPNTGLSNLKTRLQLLHGNKADLEVMKEPDMVRIVVTIPITRAKSGQSLIPDS